MTMRQMFSTSAGIAALMIVAGCTSGTTYGTGVSQETQLLQDLGGVVALGGNAKKERIDYNSRSGLVKPPQVASLPTPAVTDTSEAGYFPEDPELKRARLIASAETPDERSGEISLDEMRRNQLNGSTGNKPSAKSFKNPDHEESAHEMAVNSKSVAEEVAKRRQELKGASGAAPRRYLTEPPKEYRTPAATAEIGSVGEQEQSPNKKKKKTLLGGIFGS